MITYLGEVAAGSITTAGTTLTLTFTAPVAFGDVIVINAAAFSSFIAYAYTATDNTAGGPNVYQAPGVTGVGFAVVTHPFSIGDTITLTAVTKDAAVGTVFAFRGLGWTLTSALQALMTEQNLTNGFQLLPGIVGPNAPMGDSYIYQPSQANASIINFPPTNVDTTMTGLPLGYGNGVIVAGQIWSPYGPGITGTTLQLISDFTSGHTSLADPADIAVDFGTLTRAVNTLNSNAVVMIPYYKIVPVSAAAYSQFIDAQVIDNATFRYANAVSGKILPSPFAVDAGFLPQIGAG